MVQCLRLHALTAKGLGSIPGWGTKILQAMRHGKKKNIILHNSFRLEIQVHHFFFHSDVAHAVVICSVIPIY